MTARDDKRGEYCGDCGAKIAAIMGGCHRTGCTHFFQAPPSHALPKPELVDCESCIGSGKIREEGETPAQDRWRNCMDCTGTGKVPAISAPSTTPRKLPFSLPVYVGNEYQGMHTVFAADHAVVAECYHKGIAERIVEFFNGASVASATPLTVEVGPQPNRYVSYLIDGKPHRVCDCDPHKGPCAKGFERTLLTCELSRCFIPAPDILRAADGGKATND